MFDSCTKLAEEDSRAGQKPAHQLRLMANLALFLRYHRQDSGGKTNVVNDPVNYIGKNALHSTATEIFFVCFLTYIYM